MAWLGGAAAAGLFGGFLQNHENRQMAERQENFQREMSNTAHQRQVADLRAAGLNPILSANAGASAPQGASAQMQNAIEPGVTAALDTKRLQKDMSEAEARISLNHAQKAAAEAQSNMSNTSAKQIATQTAILQATAPATIERAKTDLMQQKYDQKFMDMDNINQRIQSGLGTANSAFDLFKPKFTPKPPTQRRSP